MARRIAIIRVPLTEEQKAHIRTTAGGANITEALVAGPVDQTEPLENEIVGDEAKRIAAEIWKGNEIFIEKLNARPQVKADYEAHTGHDTFPDVPNVAILR